MRGHDGPGTQVLHECRTLPGRQRSFREGGTLLRSLPVDSTWPCRLAVGLCESYGDTMSRNSRRTPGAAAAGPRTTDAGYQPAIDAHARKLIARIQRNHQDTEAVLALQTHYEAHLDFPSLANLLEGWASTLRDERKAAEAYEKAAAAVVAGVADPARALSLCGQALQRWPEYTPALDRLSALLIEQGNDAELERQLQALTGELARRNSAAPVRADAHYRLGQHYEQRLQSRRRAILEYRTALELDPGFTPAIIAARAIYLGSDKGQPAADMYELQIAATHEPQERHALLLALAKLRRETLLDLSGAVLALRRGLKALPGDPPTLELLAHLLRERAEHTEGDDALADRGRAAELYYQVARSVPRAKAGPRLQACLALQPHHARALSLWTELSGYGTDPTEIPNGQLSQAELDARSTDRFAPILGAGVTPPVGRVGRADSVPPILVDDEEVASWLEDDEIAMVDAQVSSRSVVPVSDRPPRPDAATPIPGHVDTERRFPV